MRAFDERRQVLHVNIESLHDSARELHASASRHDAQIAQLTELMRIDAENIRRLANKAATHE